MGKIWFCLTVMMLVWAVWLRPSGTEQEAEREVFLIGSMEDLMRLSEQTAEEGFDGEAVLLRDLEAEESILPIGSMENMFTGTFEGGGHVISGLSVSGGGDFQGFFGYVGAGGCVRNLILRDARIAGERYVGGIAAYSAGTIENCLVEDSRILHTGEGQYSVAAGGVAGLSSGVIRNCSNRDTRVVGGRYVGGVVGSQCAGKVTGCISTGPVISRETGRALAGGIAGSAQTGAAVEGCISIGEVRAGQAGWAGGAVGGLLSGRMVRCVSVGPVRGREAGGLVGFVGSRAQVIGCRYAAGVLPGTGEGSAAGMEALYGEAFSAEKLRRLFRTLHKSGAGLFGEENVLLTEKIRDII